MEFLFLKIELIEKKYDIRNLIYDGTAINSID